MRDLKEVVREITFSTSKSSGAGGQHVNKTETKVTAALDIANSTFFNDEEKAILFRKLKLTADNELKVTASSERSQLRNKEETIERIISILEKALKPEKKRIPTKISKAQKERRIRDKKLRSDKKASRSRREFEN